MLGVAPLRNTKDERVGEKIETGNFTIDTAGSNFPDFSGDYLLDFDDLFVGMEDEDVLPGLEMDAEILNDFSVSGGGDESETTVNYNTTSCSSENICVKDNSVSGTKSEDKVSGLASGSSNLNQDDVSSRRVKSVLAANHPSNKGKKSSKNHEGKRKVKVDWTPELHRRFVQAVEQLGVDKAVPSRILELMGIDCLTRHNIASHLQKYRSHRKHLLAREAEAASWSQRRQIYRGVPGGGGCKPEISNPWFAPRIGFPPAVANFRPSLHVWGHPSTSMDKRHVWPKHVHPPNFPSPPPLWAVAAPSSHPATFSHSSHLDQVRNRIPPGAPCFPPSSLASTNFAAPPLVPGIPPHPMYTSAAAAAAGAQPLPHPPSNYHPSKESIDAAIEDVLTKPWLPLPLGLKAPSTDSVVVELHRQGIDKIPPTTITKSNT